MGKDQLPKVIVDFHLGYKHFREQGRLQTTSVGFVLHTNTGNYVIPMGEWVSEIYFTDKDEPMVIYPDYTHESIGIEVEVKDESV